MYVYGGDLQLDNGEFVLYGRRLAKWKVLLVVCMHTLQHSGVLYVGVLGQSR